MVVADLMTSLAFLMALLGIYGLPSIIALDRGVQNKWSVVVINLLLGWTLVGWAVALAMAVRDKTPKPRLELEQMHPPVRPPQP